jgi:CRP-like cAMP-binding protein
VGDWIRLGEVEGKIVDVKWRAISVETRNWETVIIPNSMMMQNQFKVLGERLGESVKWRRWIWFNIDFGESPDQVIALAEQAIVAASIPGVATDPAPNCLLMDIDNSVGRYALRYWLTNLAKDDPTDSMVRQHIYAAINRQQIRLAMPRQHLYLTNKDEAYLEQKREDDLRRRTAAISQIDLFRPFTNEQLENLAGQLEYLPYAQSDIIFREGDDEHCLYVIADGTARVHVTDENGRLQHALSLGSGEFFGEMGLLTGAPRAATVTADTALECYRLGKNDFSKVLEEQDSIIEEMTRIMVSRQGVLQKAREEVHSGDGNTVQTHGHRELVSLIKHFFGTGKP